MSDTNKDGGNHQPQPPPDLMQMFRKWAKPYYDEAGLQKDAEVIDTGSSSALRLTRRHLIVVALAAMIGAGIEYNVGLALHSYGAANTTIVLFVAAIASGAAALCFAELASTLPVSGSTYTYAYTAFGQAFAWMVGWLLLIQYSVGAAVIALSWSSFVTDHVGSSVYYAYAAILIIVCTLMLTFIGGNWAKWNKWGWPLLAGLAAVSVVAKVAQLLVAIGTNIVDGRSVGLNVDDGVFEAFGLLYFSYIGFDVPSTAAEDSHYPQRDLAPSILWSLLVVSVLYLGFAISGGPPPLEPESRFWYQLGAVVGLPSGVVAFLYGQGRILRAVVRDGLLWRKKEPIPVQKEEPNPPQKKEPNRNWKVNVAAGGVSIGLSALIFAVAKFHLLPVGGDTTNLSRLLTKFVSVATGVGFAVVAAGTVVLRFRRPDLPRTFTAPFLPVAVLIAVAASAALIFFAKEILYLFLVWCAFGALAYAAFLIPRVIRNEKLKNSSQSKV